MKTIILSVQNLHWSVIHPFGRTALPLFFALAFLPSILHLVSPSFGVINPLVALSPIAAGFWLAAGLREIRVSYALFGALITALLWSANWLMTAGGGCCSID